MGIIFVYSSLHQEHFLVESWKKCIFFYPLPSEKIFTPNDGTYNEQISPPFHDVYVKEIKSGYTNYTILKPRVFELIILYPSFYLITFLSNFIWISNLIHLLYLFSSVLLFSNVFLLLHFYAID